jgi:SAM-dependent methyltransferase
MKSAFTKEELFDRSDEYEALLNQGIRLSGEDQSFFARGRVRDLRAQIPDARLPKRILDFGCGIGGAAEYLQEAFPDSEIVGVDLAENAIQRARAMHQSERVSFETLDALPRLKKFQLCYVNGVFHHIKPADRPAALSLIHESLSSDGILALFENNPWNPGTRMVMRRIPFDRDAIPMSPLETRRLLETNGFKTAPGRFLFYYPGALRFLRFTEPWLAKLPLGAQYYFPAEKA